MDLPTRAVPASRRFDEEGVLVNDKWAFGSHACLGRFPDLFGLDPSWTVFQAHF